MIRNFVISKKDEVLNQSCSNRAI